MRHQPRRSADESCGPGGTEKSGDALYSRRIVGWAMRSEMTAQLVIHALVMAVRLAFEQYNGFINAVVDAPQRIPNPELAVVRLGGRNPTWNKKGLRSPSYHYDDAALKQTAGDVVRSRRASRHARTSVSDCCQASIKNSDKRQKAIYKYCVLFVTFDDARATVCARKRSRASDNRRNVYSRIHG